MRLAGLEGQAQRPDWRARPVREWGIQSLGALLQKDAFMKLKKNCALLLMGLCTQTAAIAQSEASAPYTPSWQARHHLQLLVDHAGLALLLTHWPLPATAVEQAMADLPSVFQGVGVDLEGARQSVLRELAARRTQGAWRLQLRSSAEGLTGFDDNYTPGSSVQGVSEEKRVASGSLSLAGRLGVRVEQASNSLQQQFGGSGSEARHPLRLEGSAAVLGWEGWNVQAFSHRHWWGPGWQSSLVNGSNNPAWNGVGIQRGSAKVSSSPWLNWMGPWSFDVFVARAQDPQVLGNQPQGFLFSGMRLTMRPQPWLELGLSRGLQVGGAGRPSGAKNFIKAFFGQEVNQNPGDPEDSSGQIAGYDVRVRCPQSWGACAAYTQWMGEDAAGTVPLPYKFMSLWGVEQTYGEGRLRVFAEYTNTHANSLPWESQAPFAGYVNGVYRQGYTNGARWAGSALGGGSRVTTLGWMDAQNQRMVKVHVGKVGISVGAYDPRVDAPHGQLRGLSASQAFKWQGLSWVPELSWMQLDQGQDQRASKLNTVRVGVTVQSAL